VATVVGHSRDKYDRRILFDGKKPELGVVTPVVVTAIYRKDPASIPEGDIVSFLSNLVYYGYEYQRFIVDTDYADAFHDEREKMEFTHYVLKNVMFWVGIVSVAAGIFTIATGGVLAGLPSIMFGLDQITGTTLEFSILDESLKGGLVLVFDFAGRERSFMKWGHEFSFFHFTSSSAANFLLTHLTFMAVGGVLSGGHMFRGVLKKTVKEVLEDGAAASAAFIDEVDLWTKTGGTLRSGLRLLRWAGKEVPTTNWLARLGIRYLAETLKHVVFGACVLLALGAVGHQIGDTGLLGEILLQGFVIGSILLDAKSKRYLQGPGADYELISQTVENRIRESRWKKYFWLPGVEGIVRLKTIWSVLESIDSGALVSAIHLQMGLHVLEIAIVRWRIMV